MVADDPDRLTLEWQRAERGARIYLDVNRINYAQHAVAPYGVRARPGAPVAMPIHWEELGDRGAEARRLDRQRRRAAARPRATPGRASAAARAACPGGEPAMTLVVLTGATRGIGQAAAVGLAREGAELALVGRDPERVAAVAAQARPPAAAPVHEYVADLTLMAEVRRLAEQLRDGHAQIDVLANNAGALFAARQVTAEGFERTFALNHLAPFLLTHLLRDRLAGGRVVTTASDAHQGGRLDLDDLQSAARLRGHARLRHQQAVQHPVHARARSSCARTARQLLSPGRRAHGVWQERERDLEDPHHARCALLPVAASAAPARSCGWPRHRTAAV